jgi:hypothetical protein
MLLPTIKDLINWFTYEVGNSMCEPFTWFAFTLEDEQEMVIGNAEAFCKLGYCHFL